MNKSKLQPLKGFRDFLPQEMLERQRVFETIRSVFEKYGFLPMSTPVLEYREVLGGKYGADEKLMYKFEDQGERSVAMRYDLTVPLARFVAQYRNELPMPFKRYQIDPVWRAEKPQRGRFREFYQCDVDVVGSDSLFADAEVIACLDATLAALGVKDRVIRINNRKLLDGIMTEAGIPKSKHLDAIRILDKLDKVSEDEIRGMLASIGVQTKEADILFEKIGQEFQDAQDFLEQFKGIDGAGEFAQTLEALISFGVTNYRADFSLARGLDYYTGTIFEIILPDAAQYGSIAGGGRYDGLIGTFASEEIPAVGGSIGIDRLLAALEELELIQYDLVSDVLVCNLNEELTQTYLTIGTQLREQGIKTDIYYTPDKLDKQLKYADRKNINFALIVGPDEEKKDTVQVKNLLTGGQEAIPREKLVSFLQRRLNTREK